MSESPIRRALRAVRDSLSGVAAIPRLPRLLEQAEYLDREVGRVNAALRRQAWQAGRRSPLATQTKSSFEYQWAHMPSGDALPSDAAFMSGLETEVPDMVGVPKEWFEGKRIVDVGCGIGRYSHALLALGGRVTACDQSEAALQRTGALCAARADRLSLRRIDLLEWNDVADFDLAFCYGVVHHTGNTYLAMENVCRKVRLGGRIFFMIYAPPASAAALSEVNEYERIAELLRDRPFPERQRYLEERFGAAKAHGWFDATSPRINDRLSYEEIHDLLTELGFGHLGHRIVLRNHYVIAERVSPVS